MAPRELQCRFCPGGEYSHNECRSSHQNDVVISDCAILQAMALLRTLGWLHPVPALNVVCTVKVQMLSRLGALLELASGGLPHASSHITQ